MELAWRMRGILVDWLIEVHSKFCLLPETLFLAVNITGLTYAGVENWINQVFTGLTLILAVALAAVLSKERRTKASGARASSGSPSALTAETRNPA